MFIGERIRRWWVGRSIAQRGLTKLSDPMDVQVRLRNHKTQEPRLVPIQAALKLPHVTRKSHLLFATPEECIYVDDELMLGTNRRLK